MNSTKPKKYLKPNFSLTFLILLLALILAFPPSSSAQTLQEKVNEYFGVLLKMNRFSGSILIAKDGDILFSKGYGLANREHDVLNTPKTIFRIGSIGKQFAAMAVMQLQEQGKLDVKDTISKYIPDYPNGDIITLHHCLTHTSGIPNLTAFPEHRKTIMMPSPVEKTILRFKDKPLEFAPGEKFKYSNSGWLLLGYIIEKVSEKTYENYLKEYIFGPLNMANSGYDHHSTILKNRASGYLRTKEGIVNAPYIDMSIPHAGGALYSTVEDLLIWDQALYTEKILTKASLEKIFTPFKGNYGFGWRIDSIFGHKRIHHGGSIIGFQAHIARYVDDNIFVAFCCNQIPINTRRIAQDLAAIVFGKPYKIPTEEEIAGRPEMKKKK